MDLFCYPQSTTNPLLLLVSSVHVLSTGVRVHRDLVYAYTLGPLRIPT